MYVHTTALSLLAPPAFLLNYSGHFFFSLHVSFRRREENSGFGGPSVGLLLPPPALSLSLTIRSTDRRRPPPQGPPLSAAATTEDGGRWRWRREEERGNVVGAREKGEKRGREGGLPTSFLGAFRQGRRIAFPLYTLHPLPLPTPPKPFPFLLYRLLSLSVRPLSLLPAPLRPRNRRRRRCSPPPSIPWPNLGTFLLGRLLQGKSVRDSPVTYEEGAGKDLHPREAN